MSCVNPLIWHPPAGSSVVMSASGTQPLFNVVVAVLVNEVLTETWRHHDLSPGPKSLMVGAGQRCAFQVVLDVFSAPAAGSPVKFNAHVALAGGAIDPSRNCTFSFTHPGHFTILVFASA